MEVAKGKQVKIEVRNADTGEVTYKTSTIHSVNKSGTRFYADAGTSFSVKTGEEYGYGKFVLNHRVVEVL